MRSSSVLRLSAAHQSESSSPDATSTAGPCSTVVSVGDGDPQPPAGGAAPRRRRSSRPAGAQRGDDGGDGPGAAGAGLPHAALVHPHRHLPVAHRRHELDVHPVREQGAVVAGLRRSGPARPASTSSTQARCGLPTSTAVPANVRAADLARSTPGRRGPGPCRRHTPSPVEPHLARRRPGCPAAARPPSGSQPARSSQCAKTRTPLPHISARAAVGVAVVHEPLDARLARGTRRPSARPTGPPAARRPRRARAAVAERGDPGGGQVERAVGVGQDDEVVLGAVALGERDRRSLRLRPGYEGPARAGPGPGVEPEDAAVAAEPGALPADEPPGGAHRVRRGRAEIPRGGRAVERGHDLLVAERPGGGAALAQAVVEQRAGLRDEAARRTSGPRGGRPARRARPSGRSTPSSTAP